MEKYSEQFKEGNISDVEKDQTPEEVDMAIEALLMRLDSFDLDSFSAEIQEEWYWVENEAGVGKDRLRAKSVLDAFIKKLEKESVG